jgi:hypothetical protein
MFWPSYELFDGSAIFQKRYNDSLKRYNDPLNRYTILKVMND